MDESNKGLVYVSRKLCFSAGHRLHAKELSDEENKTIFGKCNHVNGHGHNYRVKVTVCGKMDPITGMVMNVVNLKDYMVKAIMDVMDHKFLDKDVNYFKNSPSTVENIAAFIWNQLLTHLQNETATLYEVKVCETDNISAVYRGFNPVKCYDLIVSAVEIELRCSMLHCLGANLHEILQVRGHPLKENELWVLLRSISKELISFPSSSKCYLKSFCFISPERAVLLPNGRVSIIFEETYESELAKTLCTQIKENSRWEPKSFQVYSFGLTILWCAEYGLKQNEMITWSEELHQLVALMCDETSEICLQEVYDHSHAHESGKTASDDQIITELCESIVGSILEISSFSEVLHLDASFPERSSGLDDTMLSVGSFASKDSKIHTNSTSDIYKSDLKPSVLTLEKLSPKKPFSDKTNEPSSNSSLKPNQRLKLNCSMLSKCGEEIKELNIHSSGFPNAQIHFLISYPDRSQASVTCGQVGMVQVLRSALDSWITEIDQQYFALAYWEDSEYHFLQTFVELQNRVKTCDGKQVFFLRILYFPPDTNNVDANMLRAMYFQLRVDLLDERITCIYDDALSTAALALQHEIGDYQQEYKNEYFKIDEFVPSHVVTQLGTAHVCQQVVKLHRQLAGIGHKEAQVLFLRRCSNLEEYGSNFHKTYRSKSCKSENATWLGVGPRGISVFDLKSNNSRMKRHFLKWTDLKKMNCKNRKLTFSIMNPDIKLKFYQKVQQRANYLLTVIGKLHQFYSIQKPSRKVSSLGLFDDMTKLSSSANPSPSRKTSIDQSQKTSRSPLQSCFTNSSVDYPKKFTTTPKTPLTISSSSSSRLSVDTAAVRKSSLKSQSSTVRGQIVAETHQPPAEVVSTPSHFVRSFRTIRRPSSASSSSSASQRRQQKIATSTPGLSDARSTWSVPNDEYISPVTRAARQKVEVTVSESGSFSDQLCPKSSEESELEQHDDSIHKTARDYYRTSLSSSTDVSLNCESLNSSIPSTSSAKYKAAEMEHIYDNVADDPPSSSCHSNSFSSTGITFYHSDSS